MDRTQLGSWISLHAHAERDPIRLTVTLTLGDLPQAWARSRRHRAKTWTAVIGLALVLPFTALLAASVLNAIGVNQPLIWIGSSTWTIVAVYVSVLFGIPLALVLNIWPIARLGMRRRDGEVEGLLALEFAPLHLIVIATAVIVGGFLVGHLALDSFACMRGVHAAC